MSQQRNFPAPVKTIINNTVFNLTAPCPSAENQWSAFTLNASNAGINITVWTRDPQDQNNQNGQIKFTAPLPLAFMIFKAIEDVARGKFKERSFKHEDFTWVGGKKSDKRVLISTLMIGRDDNGVYISVRSYKSDRPRINFVFGASLARQYQILDENNQPLPLAELSKEAALAWSAALAKVLAHIVVSNYKHPEPKTPTGQNNQQGGQQQQPVNKPAPNNSYENDESDFY